MYYHLLEGAQIYDLNLWEGVHFVFYKSRFSSNDNFRKTLLDLGDKNSYFSFSMKIAAVTDLIGHGYQYGIDST